MKSPQILYNEKQNRRWIISLPIIVILFLSFIFAVVILPAKADVPAPTVANVSSGHQAFGTPFGFTLTVANVGDVIAVFAQVLAGGSGTFPVISDVQSSSVSNTCVGNTGNNFVNMCRSTAVSWHCVGSNAFCDGVGFTRTASNSLWFGTANATGSITINVYPTQGGSIVAAAQAYDIIYSTNSPSATKISSCDAAANTDCGNPIQGGITSQTGSVLLVGAGTYGSNLIGATNSNGVCSFVQDGAEPNFGGAWLKGAGTCGLIYNGFSGSNSGYGMIAATFTASTTTVTSTTVVNTNCQGACTSGANSSLLYIKNIGTTLFSLTFQPSTNLPTSAFLNNVTLKVAAVHINTLSANFTLLLYYPVNFTAPASGVNQWTLQQKYNVPISNNTVSGTFIHANPQWNIPAKFNYAVGFMTNANKSRGSGAQYSGIALYEASQVGVVQYTFPNTKVAPPTSFYSTTNQSPRFFMIMNFKYPVALVTTTLTTAILTVSATVTTTFGATTQTVTSVSYVTSIDPNASGTIQVQSLITFAPLWILPLVMGGLFGFIGVFVGLILGMIIGVMTNLIPSWVVFLIGLLILFIVIRREV